MKVIVHRIHDGGSIRLQQSRRMAIITLNHLQKRNALSRDLWKQLYQTVVQVEQARAAEVVIINGQGNAFSAGSDIAEFGKMSLLEIDESFEMMERAISAVERLPIPTIGVVDGVAMGAGFELALACDIRVGSENTKMGMPVGKLGITVSQRFAKRIVDLLGAGRAKDLVFTARSYQGQEALDVGLLHYLVDSNETTRKALQIADEIQSQSHASLRTFKEMVARSVQYVEPAWNERGFPYNVDPTDFPEGVKAFVEKRKPHFQNIDRGDR